MQMKKKKNNPSEIRRKAWNILRLALLWARKGGVFKRRLSMDLSKFLHTLRRRHFNIDAAAIRYHYGEREFSFGDTPVFHIKMHRPSSLQWFRLPRIPCINPNPQVDFDYDFNDGKDNDLYLENGEEARKSFLRNEEEEMTTVVGCEDAGEGIDMKAEEFIAKIYQQIKLQRQISLLSLQ